MASIVWTRGSELHILSIAEDTGEFTEALAEVGWSIHSTGITSGTYSLFNALMRQIQLIQPDILHINPEGYGPLLPIVCAMSRRPTLRTVHNSFGFTGTLRLRKTLERWFARRLGVKFIAISQSVYDNEWDRFGNRCDLLWNWIDTQRFLPPTRAQRLNAREKFKIPADKKLLISVGNASDVKNYRVIVEALAQLADPSLLYCQIGNPHPGGLDEELAIQLGVKNQVRICGPSHQVLEWVWAADLFVMPSIFEGFGLAAVEAMATGVDCIFADCPGLVDFKEFHIPAAWVPPTAEGVAQAIRQAVNSPPGGEALATSAAKVRELFSAEIRATAYFDAWQLAVD